MAIPGAYSTIKVEQEPGPLIQHKMTITMPPHLGPGPWFGGDRISVDILGTMMIFEVHTITMSSDTGSVIELVRVP